MSSLKFELRPLHIQSLLRFYGREVTPEEIEKLMRHHLYVPCDPMPFPARENGHYYTERAKGQYTCHLFAYGRWWRHTGKTWFLVHPWENKCLSQREVAAIEALIAIKREEWLSPQVLAAYAEYCYLREDKRMRYGVKLRMLRFRRERGI
jgi:hypothetical protein